MQDYRLADLVFPETEEKIISWDFIDIAPFRIYYKLTIYTEGEQNSGFRFYIVEITSQDANFENGWDDPSVSVECQYFGIAMYDGLRHFYMGDEATDSKGYLYYANLGDQIKLFQALRELELKYCRVL